MEYALLALRSPSNIEKKVRELQSALYRKGGLASSLALPVMIPLCFVTASAIPAKRGELRDRLRRVVGKEAPRLTSKSIEECGGFLFWNLDPRRKLQQLQRSCEKGFSPEAGHHASRQIDQQPDLFPVARGFFLCPLQGRSRSEILVPAVSEPFVFPAKAAILLRIRPLAVETGTIEPGASPLEGQPLWKSLFWETLVEIPLRKSGAAR